ncbi:MAG: tripartite tricarboxylate transporter TctB family protein [Hydrogenophaga sp.]|nr:tripartite tricarboxylate transporter TctB family protein [Hydrogenophaga sp.]
MSEGGKTARSDLWGGAGWVGFGLLIVAESFRMERFESMGAQLYAMPGFVPSLIGGAIALLGVVLMLRGLLARASTAPDAPPVRLINNRVAITLALTLVYAALLIGRVPFWFATALFVAVFVAVFAPESHTRIRRAVVAIAAGVLTSAVVTLMFQQVFLVRLP